MHFDFQLYNLNLFSCDNAGFNITVVLLSIREKSEAEAIDANEQDPDDDEGGLWLCLLMFLEVTNAPQRCWP